MLLELLDVVCSCVLLLMDWGVVSQGVGLLVVVGWACLGVREPWCDGFLDIRQVCGGEGGGLRLLLR